MIGKVRVKFRDRVTGVRFPGSWRVSAAEQPRVRATMTMGRPRAPVRARPPALTPDPRPRTPAQTPPGWGLGREGLPVAVGVGPGDPPTPWRGRCRRATESTTSNGDSGTAARRRGMDVSRHDLPGVLLRPLRGGAPIDSLSDPGESPFPRPKTTHHFSTPIHTRPPGVNPPTHWGF